MSKGTGWVKRAWDRIKQFTTLAVNATWNRLVGPVARCAAWLVCWTWRTVRPTLIRALWANWKIHRGPVCDIDSEERTWRDRLQACPAEERGLAVSTLLSVFESDQNRIRGVESKARGVLQSASLVFAGDAVALNVAFREEAARATLAIWLVVVSAVYLGTALGATLYVDKLGPRHVLSLEDVLPADRAGSRLVGAIKLNQSSSLARTNLTESAIFDVARSLVTAAAALGAALLAI